MKPILKIALLLVLVWALALPGTAFAKELRDTEVVFGGTFSLASGETQNGGLVVFGGNVDLAQDSTVNGDIVLLGGNMSAAGLINGNIVIIGGNVHLLDSAVVGGDVSTVGGNLNREPGATIQGQIHRGTGGPVDLPGVRVDGDGPFSPFRVMVDAVWFLFRTFLWAALAVLVVIFLPRNIERTAQAAVGQPVASGGLGLLTALIAPILLVLMLITLILIPVSVLAAIVLAIAWAYGLISLGYLVGKRLGEAINQVWAPAAAAGIGTFLMMLVVNGTGELIPCVGWIAPFVFGIVGLGATLLTRFGTMDYPPPASIIAYPPAYPPAPPSSDWPPAPTPTPAAVEPISYPAEEPPAAGAASVFPAPERNEEPPVVEDDRPLPPVQ